MVGVMSELTTSLTRPPLQTAIDARLWETGIFRVVAPAPTEYVWTNGAEIGLSSEFTRT